MVGELACDGCSHASRRHRLEWDQGDGVGGSIDCALELHAGTGSGKVSLCVLNRLIEFTHSMYDFHKPIPASPCPQILLKLAVGQDMLCNCQYQASLCAQEAAHPLLSCSKMSLKERTRKSFTSVRRVTAMLISVMVMLGIL